MKGKRLAATWRKVLNRGERALQLLFPAQNAFRIGRDGGRRTGRAELGKERIGAPFSTPPVDKKISCNPQQISQWLAYQAGLLDFEGFEARLLRDILEAGCPRALSALPQNERQAGLLQRFLVFLGRLPVAHE